MLDNDLSRIMLSCLILYHMQCRIRNQGVFQEDHLNLYILLTTERTDNIFFVTGKSLNLEILEIEFFNKNYKPNS